MLLVAIAVLLGAAGEVSPGFFRRQYDVVRGATVRNRKRKEDRHELVVYVCCKRAERTRLAGDMEAKRGDC